MTDILLILSIILVFIILVLKNKALKKSFKSAYIPQVINIESELISLINKERKNNNLLELKPEKLLTKIAMDKAINMFNSKEVSHYGFQDRYKESKALILCENVGYNFLSDFGLFTAYMKSKAHKENILHKSANYIGVYTYGKYNCILIAKY